MKHRNAATSGAFLVVFGGLSVLLGLAARETRIVNDQAMPFGLDSPRVVTDLTTYGIDYFRTRVHPLFPLLFNPPGLLLTRLAGDPFLAALLLNALAAGTAVALAHGLFLRIGMPPLDAALWTALLGTSSAHLLFGALPETYAFSAATLVLLYRIAAGEGGWKRFLPATILSAGVTSSNLAYGVLAYAAGHSRRRLARTALFAAAAVLGVGALSLVQRVPYPVTWFFLSPGGYDVESTFLARIGSAADLLRRALGLVEQMLVVNFAAVRPAVLPGADVPDVTFATPAIPHAYAAGWLHLALWGPLLAIAGKGLHGLTGTPRSLGNALLLGLLFSLAFHMAYGTDLFLYTCQWTFPVLGLAALGMRRAWGSWRLRGILALLLVLQGTSNALFLSDLLAVYR